MLTVTIIAVIVVLTAAVGGYLWWQKHKEHQTARANGKVNQLKGVLLSKEKQAEILIESISDGIIVTDVNNTITLFNAAAAKMTDWSMDDAMGVDAKSVLQILGDEKTNTVLTNDEHPFTMALQSQKPYSETLQLVTRSNKHIYVSLSISPVITKDNQFYGLVAVFRDVSEARQEAARKDDFVSTASHEMRTPVAAIEGYLALALNDKVCKIDSKARDYLEKAHASSQHLGQLFQDLLNSSKAEDGRLSSHPVVTEMGHFVDQLAEDLRFPAEKKGCRWS